MYVENRFIEVRCRVHQTDSNKEMDSAETQGTSMHCRWNEKFKASQIPALGKSPLNEGILLASHFLDGRIGLLMVFFKGV